MGSTKNVAPVKGFAPCDVVFGEGVVEIGDEAGEGVVETGDEAGEGVGLTVVCPIFAVVDEVVVEPDDAVTA